MPIHHGVPDGWDDDWARTQKREAAVGMASRPSGGRKSTLRVITGTGALVDGQPLCNGCLFKAGLFEYNVELYTPLFRGDRWQERLGATSYQMHPYYCGVCVEEFT